MRHRRRNEGRARVEHFATMLGSNEAQIGAKVFGCKLPCFFKRSHNGLLEHVQRERPVAARQQQFHGCLEVPVPTQCRQ